MGICVATGDDTIFGRIARLTSDPKTGMTPLQKEILRFVLIISGFITCVVILIVVLWYVCRWSRATCLCLAVYEVKDLYLRFSGRHG